eukprot:500775-Prymnesium_polylepis.1
MALFLSGAVAFAGSKKTTWRDLAAVNYDFSFDKYCEEYDKVYSGADRERRAGIFHDALAEIRMHNEGNFTWKKGLSQHTDKNADEWASLKGLHRGLLFSHPRSSIAAMPPSTDSLPKELDWREKGVVTPVKNQGGC